MKLGRAALAIVYAAGLARAASAQTLPDEPIVMAGGRVTVSGDVSASFAPADPGFFNYTDYEHSALRTLRVDVSAIVNAGRHLAVLGELRAENADYPRPYALYLRLRPWADRAFDIQIGRVPPTFGAFARRTYASDNPLIGYPLAYQYLTPLRPDSLPANADELLRMRGRGWLSNFSLGELAPDRGVPLASVLRWDTGVQVHYGGRVLSTTAAVTSGTIANPLFRDDNGGRQFAGRVALTPAAGLVIGASAARGPFVSATAARGALGDGHDREFTQTAFGADFEYSRGYYLVRAEAMTSRWMLPIVRWPFLPETLSAVAGSVEARYKFAPGFYAAARADHLGFSSVTGSTSTDTWDAPVTRIEVGGGYSIQRNLLLKLSYQHNRRDTLRSGRLNIGAAQLVFWF
jgi:hypothetical protein